MRPQPGQAATSGTLADEYKAVAKLQDELSALKLSLSDTKLALEAKNLSGDKKSELEKKVEELEAKIDKTEDEVDPKKDAFIAKVTVSRSPGNGLYGRRLASLLEQSDESPVAVQGVHVVQNEQFILMLIEQLVELERREVPVEVFARAVDCLLNNGRFGETRLANKNDVVCCRCKMLDGSLKFFVGCDGCFHTYSFERSTLLRKTVKDALSSQVSS